MLRSFFQQFPQVAVAFSGGVDSAYLLYAARQSAERVHAYYVKTEFQPQFELEHANKLCKQLSVELTVLCLSQLQEPRIRCNDAQRCYYCKERIFRRIRQAAAEDGFTVLLDGTNADDDETDRPGFRALRELEVKSPLRDYGLSKVEIRRLSKEAGLFTHNKAAYACLATRIPTGEELTAEKLKRTEAAEGFLYDLGFRDFRIRCHDGTAKLQIKEAQFPLYYSKKAQIMEELGKRYSSIIPEPEVRA